MRSWQTASHAVVQPRVALPCWIAGQAGRRRRMCDARFALNNRKSRPTAYPAPTGAASDADCAFADTGASAITSVRRAQHLGHAFAGCTPESTSGVFLAARFSRLTCCFRSSGVDSVGLVQRHDLGLVGQALGIGLEFRRARSCRPCPRARRCASIRCSSTRQRSTWPRKRSPRPAPSCAPSIRPGMSAMHELAAYRHSRRRAADAAW